MATVYNALMTLETDTWSELSFSLYKGALETWVKAFTFTEDYVKTLEREVMKKPVNRSEKQFYTFWLRQELK